MLTTQVQVSFWVRRNIEFLNKSSLRHCTKREMKQVLAALRGSIFIPEMALVCQVTDRKQFSLCGILKRTLILLGLGMIPADAAGVSVMEVPSRGRKGLEEPSPGRTEES